MTTARDADGDEHSRRPSRALELLQRLLSSESLDATALASALVVTPATFEAYVSGVAPIPLERQLCLALFVIEHVPEHVRHGHQLRAQVAAAIAFQERVTEVHPQSPPTTRF